MEDVFLPAVIKSALRGAEGLPPKDKADVFRGIAALAQDSDPDLATNALNLAQAIEDSQGLQLYFTKLLAAS